MELIAERRDLFGRQTKALREKGLIPAELYGHGVVNMHLAVPAKAFQKLFQDAGTNTLLTLQIGSEIRPVLIHDIQRDYLNDSVVHIDFYQVSMKEEIKAKVPLEFVGEAPAVKEKGGILNKAITEIEVQSLPDHLPHRLYVDLKGLEELNQSIYIKNIVVPEGVKILVDADTVLVTITPPIKEEVVEAAPVDVSAVKVEDEEKKAKRLLEKKEVPKE
jgi:large subunit ribosomal protein L25